MKAVHKLIHGKNIRVNNMSKEVNIPKIEVLVEGLHSEDYFLRKTAIESIGRYAIRDERILIILREIAHRDKNIFVKNAATDTLKAFGDPLFEDPKIKVPSKEDRGNAGQPTNTLNNKFKSPWLDFFTSISFAQVLSFIKWTGIYILTFGSVYEDSIFRPSKVNMPGNEGRENEGQSITTLFEEYKSPWLDFFMGIGLAYALFSIGAIGSFISIIFGFNSFNFPILIHFGVIIGAIIYFLVKKRPLISLGIVILVCACGTGTAYLNYLIITKCSGCFT
jgi:hypothetical protein